MAPRDPPADHPQSRALTRALGSQNPQQALVAAEALVREFPDSAVAWSGLADAWAAAQQLPNAVDARQQAVRLAPDQPTLHFNLGTTLLAAGEPARAVAVFQPLSRQLPRVPRLWMNLGVALRKLGRLPDAAEALSHAAHHAAPGTPLAANIDWNRSLVHLMGGDLAAGLAAYESRRQLPRFSLPIPQQLPAWDGQTMPSKLLVVAEQGLGDTFQYTRWIRRVVSRADQVVVAVQKPLVPLLRAGLDGIASPECVIPLSRNLPVEGIDAWAPLLSLPWLLGATDRRSHVESTPWLRPDPTLVAHWTSRLAAGRGTLRIGIVWQGNPHYQDDHLRSVPLRTFAPIAALPFVQLYALQKRHGRHQLQNRPAGMTVVDLNAELDETTGPFLDTAAAMTALDLVITSDTSTLHLAGALGVHTLAAIGHVPDWRFGLQGNHLPEYPRVRLVRQPRVGDWDAVVAAMLRTIEKEYRPTAS